MIRFLDFVLSATAALLFLPFGLVIAAVLKFTGEGQILYFQERIGKNGAAFKLVKFATMLQNSPNMSHGDITVKNDPRVLPFGHWLRKSKLNEVPQLLNILIGDISIVGPRPQTEKNFALFPSEAQELIFSVKPGLTGIGSLVFRDEESIAEKVDLETTALYSTVIAPHKAALELWYLNKTNLLNYLLIILLTALSIILPGNKMYSYVWEDLPAPPKELEGLI